MYSLAMLVLHDLSDFDAVVDAWRDAGAPAITILDSLGTRELEEQARRGDLPLMPSIRDLLQAEDAPRKTVFAIVPEERLEAIIKATHDVMGDLSEAHKGILFVVPVSQVFGYREL